MLNLSMRPNILSNVQSFHAVQNGSELGFEEAGVPGND